jgi:hypothetical protein
MAFSVFVEALNLRRRRKTAVELRPTYHVKDEADPTG